MAKIRYKEKKRNAKTIAELKTLADSPQVDWMRQLAHHSQGVAMAMESIHGGRWNIAINHQHCLVMIVRVAEGWDPSAI